jgi:hypothetical protein
VAISVLKAVPLEEADGARLAAADALEARLAAEERAERAKLAAEEALQAQREAEEAVDETRRGAEQAEQTRLRDEKKAERARCAAEDALQAWRETLTAEAPATGKPDFPPPPERLRMLPSLPEADLRAAGLGLSDTSDVEAHDADRSATQELDPRAVEESSETVAAELGCQIAYWRGYRKGAFYARAVDEDGYEVALAESPLFKPRGKGVPDDTDGAVAAYEALVAQLENAGWEPVGCDDTWFGRTFRRPQPS